MATLVAFVGVYLLCGLPGLPVGQWLCGRDVRRHPEAVAYGLLVGHAAASGVVVALVAVVGFSPLALLGFAAVAAAWWAVSGRWLQPGAAPKLRLPVWDRRAWLAFLALLLVAALLVAEPFANLGRRTADGYAYRKYFAGDFLKQVAVTAELAKGEIPPQNPWFAGEPLHYYWWYFVLPAAFHRLTGQAHPLTAILAADTWLTDALFLFVLFSTLRLFTGGVSAPLLAGLIGIAGYSYEGVYLWWKLQEPLGEFLEHVRGFNIDGLTRWLWGEPQLDGFFRSLLYTPQHLQALSFLLATVVLLAVADVMKNLPLALVSGLLIGVSVGYSAFIGLFAAGWLGLYLGARLVARRAGPGALTACLASGGAVALAVLGFAGLGMFARDPDSGLVLYTGRALQHYGPLLFLINFGPPSIFGMLGLVLLWKRRESLPPPAPSVPASVPALTLLLALAVGLIATVAVQGFLSDVGLKLGLVVLAVLLIFTAGALDRLRARASAVAVGLLVVLVAGPAVPTVLLDRRNTADIGNAAFTLYVTREERQAADWIRTHVPERALVQAWSGNSRADFFSLVPILAERRTVVGDAFYARIFLVPPGAVERRRADVARLFATEDPEEAVALLRKYRIAYVYVGEEEKAAYGAGVRKFYRFPERFEPVYGNARVDVFRVRGVEGGRA